MRTAKIRSTVSRLINSGGKILWEAGGVIAKLADYGSGSILFAPLVVDKQNPILITSSSLPKSIECYSNISDGM